MKRTISSKNIAGIAVFCALSYIFYFIKFPIFPATPFLELDFSNVFIILGGYMYGPIGGVIILIIKEVLHIPVGSTGGVGELANVIVGLFYVLLPTIIYKYKKGIKTVIITLFCACVFASVSALIANRFINFPLFGLSKEMFYSVIWFILAFNLIKHISISAITLLLYKRLSKLFIKIKLKETDKKDTEKVKEIITNSEEETISVGEEYAKTLKRGDVVLLRGDLGAGKTAFIKGICKGFKLDGVTSPTYAYLNVYGDFIYHYDCYRLSCGEDAEGLGLTDYFNKDNICLIEWAENIESVLPKDYREVKIEKTSENGRRILL